MLKKVLFTHDDMDGAGCRIVFSLVCDRLPEDTWKVFNCTNSSIDDDVRNFIWNDKDHDSKTAIYFGDICCSCSTMEMLMKEFENIMAWDHHATNFPITNVLPTATIMPKNALGIMESGTSLMFKYFGEESIASDTPESYWFNHGVEGLLFELTDTIRSYDTYEWKETNNQKAKELNTLFWLLGMDRFCNRYINMVKGSQPGMNGSLFCAADRDFIEAKLENEQKAINNFTMDKVYPISVRGYSCAFAVSTLGANVSELAYQFLRAHPEYDLFIQYSLQTNTFQIRTGRDDLDTGAEIAAPIGGGGHPAASGASLSADVKDQIIDLLINYLNIGYDK